MALSFSISIPRSCSCVGMAEEEGRYPPKAPQFQSMAADSAAMPVGAGAADAAANQREVCTSSSTSMGVRTNSSRHLSFQLLSSESPGDSPNVLGRFISDSIVEDTSSLNPPTLSNHKRNRRRRNKGSKRNPGRFQSSRDDSNHYTQHSESSCSGRSISNPLVLGTETILETVIASLGPDDDLQYLQSEHRIPGVELRQRAVNGCMSDEPAKEESFVGPGSISQQRPETKSVAKLETAESLDWKRVMADNSDCPLAVEKMPLKYFIGELYGGNSLRSTTSLENEKKRQRVYNTMFHVPWRCELLIDVGFFACLDSFLSLLTIMPARILMTCWRFLNVRQFQRPCAAELSDFGSFIVLACGVILLQATDISLIYHFIRGQGTIKLYVVYNVLEIFDKLCQSFGSDVLQVLFNSAEGVANCPPENIAFELMRFILDQTIAVIAFIAHSFVLLAQAITLSTCIVAHNNALLALLVSNNFAEIKSNVFKRVSKDNLHSLVYHDTIERFHITAFVLFVLAQNILEAEGPWFGSFLSNALLVYVCEMFIDVIKHSFLAKFNEIKPVAYSEFLEALCKQTLDTLSEDDDGKTLDFIPLAPACVVIRVLTPIYAAHLPHGPLVWRLLWIFILSAMTYMMLATLKIMVGMGLRLHAQWYIKRCLRRRKHLHLD